MRSATRIAANISLLLFLLVSMSYPLDAQAQSSLPGRVKAVQQQRDVGGGSGTHLLLATRTGLVEVCLGPTSFLEANHALPRAGDILVVTGYPATTPSGPVFLASSLTSGDRTFVLRTASGAPRWPGCGHDCGRAGACDSHHAAHHENDAHH